MSRHKINTTKLIEAVKKRPALYQRDLDLYCISKTEKAQLWSEVEQELQPRWAEMKSHEKICIGRDIRSRWKNLRTCFVREVFAQANEHFNTEKNEENKPRKIYSHFRKLRFLLPHVNTYGLDANSFRDNESDEEAVESNDEHIDDDFDDEDRCLTVKRRKSEEPLNFEEINVLDNREDSFKTEFVNSTATTSHERDFRKDSDAEIDDDKMFLLSLLKSFRKFNEKQKYDAKIEILKVMKSVTFGDNQ